MNAPHDAESLQYLPQLVASRAASDPSRVFIHEADTGASVTYAQAEEQVKEWVQRLIALGVGPGDPVLVMLPTGSVAAFVWIAIARLRAIEAPVNLDYRGHILAHVFANSQAKVAVVAGRALTHVMRLPEPPGSLETVVVVDGEPDAGDSAGYQVLTSARVDAMVSTVALQEPAADHGWPQPHDVASLFYTSGTTGLSKGVVVTWKQIDRIARWYFPPGSLEQHEVTYAPFPMFHLSGKVLIMIAAITNGSVVLRERFKSDRYWPDVHAYSCTSTMLLGSMPDFVLGAPGFVGSEQSTLDKVVMNPLVARLPEFEKKFGVRVCGLYGSTEVGIPIATGWDRSVSGSCGRVCPDFEVRIVDEHDNELPDGVTGELVVRTTEPWLIMAGYWGMPEATLKAWSNLWFHTGDIMRRDTHGNFFFVDRIKDMIRRRGENISSMELEREILDHPAILDCAAVGVRGDWIEEEVLVVATRVAGTELGPDELTSFLSERVAPFMVPRFVQFVDDLPRTETGKVRKQVLRDIVVTDNVWDRTAQV